MPAGLAQQLCWNHPGRGAVCRCPACQRSFCRECVSEHDARLLCAACIRDAIAAALPQTRRRRRVSLIPVFVLLTTLLAWAALDLLGTFIMDSVSLSEREQWRGE